MVSLKYSSVENSSTTSEEKMLLNKLAQGDRTAFWSLWELYRNYLYHRCFVWMERNHDDAHEAISLATLKAWDKLPKYAQNITNLKGWLNRFTHNLCMDVHRQRKHNPMGVENIEDVPLNNHEIGSANYPESELLQKERYIYLRHCIDRLPSRLRDPLILNYYQAMSHADIAQQLSISQDNVAKRLQEAKQTLKRSLDKYFAGLQTEKIAETQCQKLEQQDLVVSVNTNSNIEEINYRITISCLETLPPVWCNFHHLQD